MNHIAHDGYTLTRDIAACPAHVFALWADPEKKRAWFAEDGAPTRDHSADFRVGGTETGRFVVEDGPGAGEHQNVTHYLDIAPDEHIVMAYTMAWNGRIHSASLVTVSFEDLNGGTRLTYDEKMTLIGRSDGAEMRRHGWRALLDRLERQLAEDTR